MSIKYTNAADAARRAYANAADAADAANDAADVAAVAARAAAYAYGVARDNYTPGDGTNPYDDYDDARVTYAMVAADRARNETYDAANAAYGAYNVTLHNAACAAGASVAGNEGINA